MTHPTRGRLTRTATASCLAAAVAAGAILALQPGSSAAEVGTAAAIERTTSAAADENDRRDGCAGGPWGPDRQDLPQQLREDLEAAWDLDSRTEARAELERIYEAALAGEYGAKAQELAEQRNHFGPWGGGHWRGERGPWGQSGR